MVRAQEWVCLAMHSPYLLTRTECWAGPTFESGATNIDDAFCFTECPGNPEELCGGPLDMQVWFTGTSYDGESPHNLHHPTKLRHLLTSGFF